METRKVVIVGGGTVGGGVYQTIERNGGLIASRSGIQLDVASVVVRDLAKPRRVAMPSERMTTDWRAAIEDPSVDVVIELMGGLDAADEVTRRALELKKPVVTANKALLAERGAELFAIARENNANIYFEAAVAGGIPIIKALREGMVANSIDRLYGIVNGTCNYILTRMENEGADFEPILQQAQELGFAEAEPSLDVDGLDAMHKACLMASLIHGFWVSPDDIHVEGIRRIDQTDIRFARSHGYAIKLLAVIKRLNGPEGDPQIQVSVAPALVPKSNVLASVDGAFNAIFAQGDVVGDTLYYGPGAGQDPTASAVVSDIVDACLDLKHDSHDRAFWRRNAAATERSRLIRRSRAIFTSASKRSTNPEPWRRSPRSWRKWASGSRRVFSPRTTRGT